MVHNDLYMFHASSYNRYTKPIDIEKYLPKITALFCKHEPQVN